MKPRQTHGRHRGSGMEGAAIAHVVGQVQRVAVSRRRRSRGRSVRRALRCSGSCRTPRRSRAVAAQRARVLEHLTHPPAVELAVQTGSPHDRSARSHPGSDVLPTLTPDRPAPPRGKVQVCPDWPRPQCRRPRRRCPHPGGGVFRRSGGSRPCSLSLFGKVNSAAQHHPGRAALPIAIDFGRPR